MVRFVPPCVLLREEKVHGGMIEKGVRVCGGGWMEDVVGVGGVHVYKECILGTVDVCVRGARCAVRGGWRRIDRSVYSICLRVVYT